MDIVSSDRIFYRITLVKLFTLLGILAAGLVALALSVTGKYELLQHGTALVAALIIASTAYFLISRAVLHRLTEKMREHTEFISNASHELKTPLTIMKTQLEVALRYPKEIVPEETYIEVLEEVNRMQKLVEDILSLSKNELALRKIRNSTTALNELLEGVVRKLGPYAASKHVRLTLSDRTKKMGPITVLGDSLKMAEVLLNITRNSIDYSKAEGGQVQLEVDRRRGVKRVIVRVRDTGIGIAPEHIAHIFDRFYQVDKGEEYIRVVGSGLGLAISKSIVEDLGGSIQLTSELGIGTTVNIEFLRVQHRAA